MKTIKFLLIGGALVLSMTSCNNTQKKADDNLDSTEVTTEQVKVSKIASEYLGTFEGTLPCADCEGIKIVLTLRDDTTYDLSEEYMSEKGDKFQESGVYNVLEEENVIELVTPSTNEKTYYKMQEGKLLLVGDDFKVNEGELADKYVLTKVVEEK